MTHRCSLSKLKGTCSSTFPAPISEKLNSGSSNQPKNMKPSWLSHPKRHSPENAQGAHSLGKICESAGALGSVSFEFTLMPPGARTICETQSRKLSWTLDSPGGFMLRGRKEKGTIWDLEMTCIFFVHVLWCSWFRMGDYVHLCALLIIAHFVGLWLKYQVP